MEKQISRLIKIVEEGDSSYIMCDQPGMNIKLEFTTTGISLSGQSLSGSKVPCYFYFAGGYIRMGERDDNFVIDRKITSLGFLGTEDVDWENIGGAGV